jgi:hypothetical protein
MIIKSPPKLTNNTQYVKFIQTNLWSWLKEMSIMINKINFKDNFQAFTVNALTIPAGQEVAIPNELRTKYPGVIPIGRIIVRQTGNANIIDGDTPWTNTILYLKNPSANDAVVSVLFYI